LDNKITYLAPIILFVYKRPEHTQRTLDSLAANPLLEHSELIIFADGPKNNASEEDLRLIQLTRSICKAFDKSKKLSVVENKANLGLAKNIIEGVSKTVESHGKVIVVEDDLELSPSFLNYMNDALQMYEDDDKVFHISGYWFPVKNSKSLPETFFLDMATCWGWGTWKRAWKNFNPDVNELKKEIAKIDPEFKKFDYQGKSSFLQQIDLNIEGKLQTWAIKWYGSIFINSGLSLHPNVSYVNNTGHDGTGENSIHQNQYQWHRLANYVPLKKIKLEQSDDARSRLQTFFESAFITHREPTLKKIAKKVLPAPIKNFIKAQIRKTEEKQYDYLLTVNRYTAGTTPFLGKKITYLDGPSFWFMHSEIFKKEIYKLSLTKRKPFFIDGGANIGLASIYLKLHFPDAEIIAFEPDSKVADALKKNLTEEFKFNDIQIIQKGLWDEEKELSFYSEGADGGRVKTADDSENIVRISTVKLSDYIQKDVDFLKLDIEGAEYNVLKEIEPKLHLVSKLFIEYHSFVNQEQNLAEIITILKRNGYRLNINTPGLVSNNPFSNVITYNGMDMQLNIFAFKE
jgi:FkbM family methyltransferase